MTSVHLDTDIGDDIDDAFCLALLLRCPELQLKSVTTVLNDTAQRADMCADLLDAAGIEVPIGTGCRGVMTQRPNVRAISRLPNHGALKDRERKTDVAHALQLLKTARAETDVLLTIGPMTNLAMSLVADPNVSRFPRYIAMAGEVKTPAFAEWNIRVDPEAAAIVCNKGIAIDFIPWRIGIDTKLTEADEARLGAAATPVMNVLNAFRREFAKKDGKKEEMFDPMTVVALLHEEWFTWQRGTMHVETRGEHTFSQTTFHPSDTGPHRVAFGVDAPRAKKWLLDRLCS